MKTYPKESRTVEAQELSTLLWRERELLELLVFKLEEEQLLLTAGRSKWLPFATREVEQVLERLRTAGLERAIAVSALAEGGDVADDATLRDIIAATPDGPWRDIFEQHLQALVELAEEIARVRDDNLHHLRAAARNVQESLASINPDAGTYDAHGGAAPATAEPRLIERDL